MQIATRARCPRRAARVLPQIHVTDSTSSSLLLHAASMKSATQAVGKLATACAAAGAVYAVVLGILLTPRAQRLYVPVITDD